MSEPTISTNSGVSVLAVTYMQVMTLIAISLVLIWPTSWVNWAGRYNFVPPEWRI